jgi:hypothetical protein
VTIVRIPLLTKQKPAATRKSGNLGKSRHYPKKKG